MRKIHKSIIAFGVACLLLVVPLILVGCGNNEHDDS